MFGSALTPESRNREGTPLGSRRMNSLPQTRLQNTTVKE